MAAAAVLVAGCTGDEADVGAPGATGPPATAPVPPGGDALGAAWPATTPEEAGFDAAALDALAADAEASGSTCLFVARDGEVVAEHDWAGDDPAVEGFSVTKSLTSLLVGIARDRGLLDLDDAAATYIPEWEGTPSAAVTVRDLLANTSGRHWDLRTDYRDMAAQAEDKTAFAIGLGQDAPPGEVWAYNNSAIQTLDRVLEEATGQDPATFAEEVLFGPLGMQASSLTHDPAGNTLTFMGVQTTCADLARVGQLVLQDGRWGDRQIVSSAYLDEALSPSSAMNSAYGLLWWLNRPGTVVSPLLATGQGTGTDAVPATQVVPGAPEDVVWALGLGDQVLVVAPSEGVVAVRLGERPPPEQPFGAAQLTRGVLGARTG